MKKFLSIVLAVIMVCSLTVAVAAEEVLFSEKTMFWSNGNWTEYDLPDLDWELLNNENAVLRITRSAESTITFSDGVGYEKFCLVNSWWGCVYPNPLDSEAGFIQLGTRGHTSADEASVLVDCLSDDGTVVCWSAKAIYDIVAAGGGNEKGNPHLISNSSPDGVYDIVSVEVVVLDAPVEAAPETTAEPETTAPETTAPETTTPAPATETTKAPATGLALAVVPAVMALAAVAVSKKH